MLRKHRGYIITASLFLALILCLGGVMISKGTVNIFGDPRVSKEDAEKFNAEVHQPVVDFYATLCTSYTAIRMGGDALATLPEKSELTDTVETVRDRTLSGIDDQIKGVDQAVGILESADAPDKVEYLGKKGDRDFRTVRDNTVNGYRSAVDPLNSDRTRYSTVKTEDDLKRAQDDVAPDMEKFSTTVHDTLSTAFTEAPITSDATQKAIRDSTECHDLFSDSEWSDTVENKAVDQVVVGFFNTMGTISHDIDGSLSGLSEVSGGDGMTIGEAASVLLEATQPVLDTLNTSLDTLKKPAPSIGYPREDQKVSLQETQDKIQDMLVKNRDALDQVIIHIRNVSSVEGFTAAQEELSATVSTLSTEKFDAFKDLSASFRFPTDATRTAVSESPACDNWCTF